MSYFWLISFILTVILEFFVLWAFFRKNLSVRTIFYFCFLINLFTWPLANLIYGFYNNLYVIEAGVFLVESILVMLLFRINYLKALLISFVANLISALVGFLLAIFHLL